MEMSAPVTEGISLVTPADSEGLPNQSNIQSEPVNQDAEEPAKSSFHLVQENSTEPMCNVESSLSKKPEQNVLLIHEQGQPYQLESNHDIPSVETEEEILLKVIAVGLNPIDWKGPKYNLGLPCLPWINGRDLAGIVVNSSKRAKRVQAGDSVIYPSTDYRDIRKAAFQEYVIATEHNVARVPQSVSVERCTAVGVAFTASAICLAICLGVNFSELVDGNIEGPDLLGDVRRADPSKLEADIRDECLLGIREDERPRPGDWIAIWGASSSTGFFAAQLAKRAKLRTICIVDCARHGNKLLEIGAADLLVDRYDPERAIAIIRGVTNGQLRFALDTVCKDTAEKLQSTLATHEEDSTRRSHIAGLTGLPISLPPGVVGHKVPIKIFHGLRDVGEKLMTWLEELLTFRGLVTPEVEIAEGGLSGINKALGDLESGNLHDKRIIVPLQEIQSTQKGHDMTNVIQDAVPTCRGASKMDQENVVNSKESRTKTPEPDAPLIGLEERDKKESLAKAPSEIHPENSAQRKGDNLNGLDGRGISMANEPDVRSANTNGIEAYGKQRETCC